MFTFDAVTSVLFSDINFRRRKVLNVFARVDIRDTRAHIQTSTDIYFIAQYIYRYKKRENKL